MRKSTIEQAFLKAGLQARISTIDQLTRNSVRLATQPVEENKLAPGISKIGGHPDLPENLVWPTLKGQPQSFLAQFRLADLQQFNSSQLLPAQDMLWFFYDATQQTFGEQPEDRAGWRILCDNHPAPSLQRQPTPAGLPASSLFPACALTPRNELTLASQPELEIPNFDWSDAEQQAYEKVLEALRSPEERALPHHRLLGYPDTIQDDMREQCQLVSNGVTASADPRAARLQAGASDWLLLLQIDTDASAKMLWANNGMIYYWIKRTDLRECRFDGSWLVLQAE
ncbi:MAG TPA: YwqG family protein [Ktedonobacteraceae bacterium]